jgi:hypothetical protein
LLPNKFHAAGRVIKRDFLGLLEPAEEFLALSQGDGVRINLFDLSKTAARMSNQAVLDADVSLTDGVQPVPGQQVEILVNASRQGILDGYDGEGAPLARDAVEDILEGVAGDGCYATSEDLISRVVAESSQFTLEGYRSALRDLQPQGTLH